MGQVNLQMIQSGSPLWEWISEMQRDEMTSEMTCLSGKSAVPLLARRVSRPDVSASPKMPAPMRRSGAASALWVASALLAVLLPTRTADAAALSAAVHGYATVNSTVEFGPGNTYWCAGTPAHPLTCAVVLPPSPRGWLGCALTARSARPLFQVERGHRGEHHQGPAGGGGWLCVVNWHPLLGRPRHRGVHLDAAGGVRVERVDRPGQRRQVRAAHPRDRYTSDLSPAWRAALAPSTPRSYFYNSVTGESSWERPAPLSWVAAERGWWSNNVTSATSTTEPEAFGHLSADGKRYWVVNGEATWTAPKVRDARAPHGC